MNTPVLSPQQQEVQNRLSEIRYLFLLRLRDPNGNPFELFGKFFPEAELCAWFDSINPDQFEETAEGSKWLPLHYMFEVGKDLAAEEIPLLFARFTARFEYVVKEYLRSGVKISSDVFVSIFCMGMGLPESASEKHLTLGMSRIIRYAFEHQVHTPKKDLESRQTEIVRQMNDGSGDPALLGESLTEVSVQKQQLSQRESLLERFKRLSFHVAAQTEEEQNRT